MLAGVLPAGQDVDAQDEPQAREDERLVVVAGTPRFPGVVALFRAFLAAVEALDGVVHVHGPVVHQQRQEDAVLERVQPGVPRGAADDGLEKGPADTVFRHDSPEAQRLGTDGVAAQDVDVLVARQSVENGHQDRPHDICRGRGVGTGVGQRGTAQETVEKPGLSEILGEMDDAAQGGHLSLAVPFGAERPASATQDAGGFALTFAGGKERIGAGDGVHGRSFRLRSKRSLPCLHRPSSKK